MVQGAGVPRLGTPNPTRVTILGCHRPANGAGTTVYGMSVVERLPREGLIWSGSTSARVRPWAHDPLCGHLLLTGSHDRVDLPDAGVLRQWKATARQWGYSTLRTSALPAAVVAPLEEVGFRTVQELTLLSVAHHERPRFGIPRDVAPRPVRNRSVTADGDLCRALLAIDHASFDTPWQMDAATLRDALAATASSRVFVTRRSGRIDGFVVVGATQRTGFIQRLAVHPDSRRTGTASRLVARALEWSHRKGCSTTVVNTETTNAAALGLYASLDFAAHDDGLVVMETDLS